jgi:hypothetical protein
VGFQDSLDVDPYVWKVRDTVVLIYGLFFRFVVADGTSWWSWPFVWVRLLAIIGHRVGGRVGRIITYAAWIAFCIWVRETQCPTWVSMWVLPNIGNGIIIPGYMAGATLGNFEAMHWLGLELGPFLRSSLQRVNYFAGIQGRRLIALAFLVMLVFIPWAFPMGDELDPAAVAQGTFCQSSLYQTPKDLIRPALNTLGATAALGGFMLFAIPAGWHLPPTWALSSVLISMPMYYITYWCPWGPGFDLSHPKSNRVLNLMPNFLRQWYWQMHENVISTSQGWLWAILLVVTLWVLLTAYYVIVGVLTHEIGSWISRCSRAVKGWRRVR